MQKRIENYSPKSNNHLTVIYQKPTSPPNGKIHFYGQKSISTVFEIIEKKCLIFHSIELCLNV